MVEEKIFHNACPRNCYDTCSILSHVQDGKLVKVSGDPHNSYTCGRLCAKGYAYTRYVYNPNRLRYPLRQYPRGSGHWERLTWNQAISQIAEKILELFDRYGSNLAVGYNKFSGNLGLLHYAVEGMFNSIGAHTKPKGNPCLAAGWDAMAYDFGELSYFPDPERMADAHAIVLWGANPAWTAVHQMSFINQARDKGGSLIVIDPLFSATAAQADIYLQIKPGTDGMLALGVIKWLMEKGKLEASFLKAQVRGWDRFIKYMEGEINLQEVCAVTGVSLAGVEALSRQYLDKPCVTWIGYGMQRHRNGGQNVRAINALAAVSGNLNYNGGGLFYNHPWGNFFPRTLLNIEPPVSGGMVSREVDINNFAEKGLELLDPPLKMLYIACRNPLTQDQNLKAWHQLIARLELVVTTDLVMTKTAEASDLVLPTTTHFEEFDINVGYWHRWLALNEKAIEPLYEAKSDLEIARMLTSALNKLRPGFSSFPWRLSAPEWIERELSPRILQAYGLNHWEELKNGPSKLKYPEKLGKLNEGLNLGKFEFYSESAKKNSLPAIAKFLKTELDRVYPLHLLTPQSSSRIHSQFQDVDWLQEKEFEGDEVNLGMNRADAEQRRIRAGDWIEVRNDSGTLKCKAVISAHVPAGVVIIPQGGVPVNSLLTGLNTDMGIQKSGSSGGAFYDAYVEIKRLDDPWDQ